MYVMPALNPPLEPVLTLKIYISPSATWTLSVVVALRVPEGDAGAFTLNAVSVYAVAPVVLNDDIFTIVTTNVLMKAFPTLNTLRFLIFPADAMNPNGAICPLVAEEESTPVPCLIPK